MDTSITKHCYAWVSCTVLRRRKVPKLLLFSTYFKKVVLKPMNSLLQVIKILNPILKSSACYRLSTFLIGWNSSLILIALSKMITKKLLRRFLILERMCGSMPFTVLILNSGHKTSSSKFKTSLLITYFQLVICVRSSSSLLTLSTNCEE